MYIVVFDDGDEFIEGMLAFAHEKQLTAASFTAIGGFQQARLGFFDFEVGDYIENPVHEQVEVLSLSGNISEHEGQPKVHAHVVLGKRNAAAIGGHLLEAHICPTLEVIVTVSPEHLYRKHDEKTGIPLIKLNG